MMLCDVRICKSHVAFKYSSSSKSVIFRLPCLPFACSNVPVNAWFFGLLRKWIPMLLIWIASLGEQMLLQTLSPTLCATRNQKELFSHFQWKTSAVTYLFGFGFLHQYYTTIRKLCNVNSHHSKMPLHLNSTQKPIYSIIPSNREWKSTQLVIKTQEEVASLSIAKRKDD